jgi:hypothetical protein
MFKPFPGLARTAPAIAVAALLAGSPGAGAQGTGAGITTAQIMSETITAMPSCLNYQVTGVCVFLRCYLWYCTTQYSLRVQHYMPDDVVSTYSSPDQHPWIDVGKLLSTMLKTPGDSIMGSITDAQADTWAQTPTRENIVLFKSADAIGNPVEAIVGGNMNFEFPDFNELMKFSTTGLSQIGQMWSQVPSQLVNSTQVNVSSMLTDAQKLVGQVGNLPSQFSGMLSNTGSQIGNLSGDLKGVMTNANTGSQGGGLGGQGGQQGSFSDTLTQSGFDMKTVGSDGNKGFNQMGDSSSMQGMADQLGSIMGNAVGSAGNNNFSSSSDASALSDMNELICPGGSGLLSVNFNSNLDSLFWRGVIPLEQLYPGSLIPGVGEVGNGLVKPRQHRQSRKDFRTGVFDQRPPGGIDSPDACR